MDLCRLIGRFVSGWVTVVKYRRLIWISSKPVISLNLCRACFIRRRFLCRDILRVLLVQEIFKIIQVNVLVSIFSVLVFLCAVLLLLLLLLLLFPSLILLQRPVEPWSMMIRV